MYVYTCIHIYIAFCVERKREKEREREREGEGEAEGERERGRERLSKQFIWILWTPNIMALADPPESSSGKHRQRALPGIVPCVLFGRSLQGVYIYIYTYDWYIRIPDQGSVLGARFMDHRALEKRGFK